jgi:acyl-CoA-binding protein
MNCVVKLTRWPLFVCWQKFQEAADSAKKLTKRPSDDELLELYALYKQATVGDNDTGNRPQRFSWLFDFFFTDHKTC